MTNTERTVRCNNGHIFKIDADITIIKCPICGIVTSFRYNKLVGGKYY